MTSNPDPVEALARAVLYEGCLLYPYRRTALKNRHRWNFGVLFPPAYCSQHDPSEAFMSQTECLLEGTSDSSLEVTVRFLQKTGPADTGPAIGDCELIEREVATGRLRLDDLLQRAAVFPIRFEKRLEGRVEITAIPSAQGIFRLNVRILNQSFLSGENRDQALESAFISTHVLLAAQRGRFTSMIDPPEALRELVATCRNIGTWPVLVGPEGTRARMLSCAVILHDYPKISAQSPGDLFDATEIDELLTLRVRTLSESEKEALRGEAPPIRSILERSDGLSEEELCHLHASMRVKNTAGCPYRAGDRVRLRPRGRADIFDLVLAGKAATVISVEQDFEGQFYLCVIVEDDPGQDFGLEGKPGHRFFFRPDEVERLSAPSDKAEGSEG